MDYNNNDIIIARATPIGSSALASIRISGHNLSGLLSFMCSEKKNTEPLFHNDKQAGIHHS